MAGGFVITQSLGTLIPDVVMEARPKRSAVLTENPVMIGAEVSDHMYLKQVEITLQLGWSNLSDRAAGNPQYAANRLADLEALQASRQPFTVVTRLRTYDEIVILEIDHSQTYKTADALLATVLCKGVLRFGTQTVTLPPTSRQAMPSATAATQKRQIRQGQPVTPPDKVKKVAAATVDGIPTSGRSF